VKVGVAAKKRKKSLLVVNEKNIVMISMSYEPLRFLSVCLGADDEQAGLGASRAVVANSQNVMLWALQ